MGFKKRGFAQGPETIQRGSVNAYNANIGWSAFSSEDKSYLHFGFEVKNNNTYPKPNGYAFFDQESPTYVRESFIYADNNKKIHKLFRLWDGNEWTSFSSTPPKPALEVAKDSIAKRFGYDSYADMAAKVNMSKALMDGSYLQAGLLNIAYIFAQNENITGTLQLTDGVIKSSDGKLVLDPSTGTYKFTGEIDVTGGNAATQDDIHNLSLLSVTRSRKTNLKQMNGKKGVLLMFLQVVLLGHILGSEEIMLFVPRIHFNLMIIL